MTIIHYVLVLKVQTHSEFIGTVRPRARIIRTHKPSAPPNHQVWAPAWMAWSWVPGGAKSCCASCHPALLGVWNEGATPRHWKLGHCKFPNYQQVGNCIVQTFTRQPTVTTRTGGPWNPHLLSTSLDMSNYKGGAWTLPIPGCSKLEPTVPSWNC